MPVVNREKEREIVRRALERGWSEEKIKKAVLEYRKLHVADSETEEQEPGLGKKIVQGAVKSSLKLAAAVPAATMGGANLLAALVSKIKGDDERASEFVGDAKESLTKERNFGFLGKSRPISIDQETGEGLKGADLAKDVVGTATEIGSYIPIGSGAASVLKSGFKGLVKQGVKKGALEGAIGGAMQGAGNELQRKDSTISSVARGGLAGGLTGLAAGATIGAALPVAGLGTRKAISTARNGLTEAKTLAGEAANKPAGATIGAALPVAGLGTRKAISTARNGLTEAKTLAGEAANKLGGTLAKTRAGQKVIAAKDVIAEPILSAKESIARAPSRFAINSATKKTEREALEKLPSAAQEAVANGVEPRDAQFFIDGVTDQERSVARKMFVAAKRFAESRGSKDPAETLGAAVQGKIKSLRSIAAKQGQKLGEFASQLKATDVSSVSDDVLKRLREVPGLGDLQVGQDGMLDFSGTRLSSSLTKTDRAAINKAWKDMLGRDGKRLHTFRQELFEVLDGQKRSLIMATDTQDRAFQAIRQGIADTLEKTSKGYKGLNKAYAEVLGPLTELKKFYKGLDGATDDMLNERGAMLARRLNSRAMSASQIRNIFEQMDDVLGKHGKADGVSIKRMQDFYDMLQRYYDITPDQSFAGQSGLANGNIPGNTGDIKGWLVGKVTDAVGVTPDVKRDAFERMFRAFSPGLRGLKK